MPYIVSLCLFLANMMFPLKYLPRVLFGDSATLISIVVGGGTGATSAVHFALLRFIGSSAMSPFIEADLKPFTELDKHFGICTINFFLSILLADMNLPCANNMKYGWNSSSAFSLDFHRYFSNSTLLRHRTFLLEFLMPNRTHLFFVLLVFAHIFQMSSPAY